MEWQESIINRLNLREPSPRIVLDKIGILLTEPFMGYLNRLGIRHCRAGDVAAILQGLQEFDLIIAKPIQLPNYLEAKAEVIEFDGRYLPIDIAPEVLARLAVDDLIALLEYHSHRPGHQLIQPGNYLQVLAAAEKFRWQRQVAVLAAAIERQCQQLGQFGDFLTLADLWGQYAYACYRLEQEPGLALPGQMDQATAAFLRAGGHRDAFYAPVPAFQTVDKILPFIRKHKPEKFALVCFDGMGLAEWYLLRQYLGPELQFSARPVFALIPTMTRFSRAAIFYADAESVYALPSVNEDRAFREFFARASTASYREGEISAPDKLLGIDAVKIIYNVFDDLAHKTVLPPDTLNKHLYWQNVDNYLKQSRIKAELTLLRHLGYRIWLCSDHGSVCAVGNGQAVERYLIESAGKRGTIVANSELVHFADFEVMDIPFVRDKIVVLARDRTAFTTQDKIEITHGGITVDELVVPFVEVLP